MKCEDCKWYSIGCETSGYGQCRKKPPVISANMDTLNQQQPGGGYFPVVWDNAFCGEFEEKAK